MEIRAIAEMKVRPGVSLEFAKDCALKMESRTRELDHDTLAYNFYVDAERGMLIAHEHYRDSAAMIAHLGNLDPEVTQALLSAVEISAMKVYGEVSAELRDMLAAFGSGEYCDHLCGFDRPRG